MRGRSSRGSRRGWPTPCCGGSATSSPDNGEPKPADAPDNLDAPLTVNDSVHGSTGVEPAVGGDGVVGDGRDLGGVGDLGDDRGRGAARPLDLGAQ
jgi:hypothetical protein